MVIRLLLCMALLLGNAFAADKKSDKELDGLKGPVGSVRVERAEISNETGKAVEGQRSRRFKLRYSEKGELAERISYYGEWIASLHLFRNDPPGVKQEVIFERGPIVNAAAQETTPTAAQQPGNRVIYKHFFQYDAKGNRIENSILTESDQPFGKEIFVFDDKGNNVEVKSLNERGRLVLKTTFTFDSKGAIASSSTNDETGKLIDKRSYAYEFDAQGNWIKQTISKVLANGKAEPVEVLYRTISYYAPVGKYLGGIVGGVRNAEAGAKALYTEKGVIAIKGEVIAGKRLRTPQPSYPPLAKAARVSGAVIVEVSIDEEGDVLSARTLQGHPLLKDAAEKAALGWKFEPTMLDGLPVRVVGTVTFNFNL